MERKTCGRKTEVYSRVVGYYRPVSQWNKGKRQEFDDRTEFVVGDASGHRKVETPREHQVEEIQAQQSGEEKEGGGLTS